MQYELFIIDIMRVYTMNEIPDIHIGCEATINHQDILFTVTDIFYDEYSNEYCTLVYCKDANSDRPLSFIEIKKISTKACKIWLF